MTTPVATVRVETLATLGADLRRLAASVTADPTDQTVATGLVGTAFHAAAVLNDLAFNLMAAGAGLTATAWAAEDGLGASPEIAATLALARSAGAAADLISGLRQ